MLHRIGSHRLLIFLLLLFCLLSSADAVPRVQVRAVLGSPSVQLGGSTELQIQIQGSDHPNRPRLAALKGASLTYEGGSSNDSTEITVINGQQSTVVRKGYIFTYRLYPEHTGTVSIPPFTVSIGGTSYQTNPVSLSVSRARKTTAFLLRLSLDRNRLFVGEATVLTVKWYISQDVGNVSFHLPMLSDPAFAVKAVHPAATGSNLVQLPIAQGRVTASRSSARRDGRGYTLIQFREILVPRKPGSFSFTDSSLELTTQPSGSSFFSSFFGSAGSPRSYVVPGNPLEVKVRPLPTAGRPANFSGLVGRFSLSTSSSPHTVNVGDPIVLQIRLTGGADISSARIPALSTIPGFAGSFRLPQGEPIGKVSGSSKIFAQTIRATSDKVRSIPSVEIPYFDPTTRRYEVLRSRATKLVVRPTHILTAKDLQGSSAATPSIRSSSPTASTVGIDYNYEGPEVLAQRAYSPVGALLRPLPLAVTGVPLLAFLGLIAVRRLRNSRRSGSGLRDAERELRELCTSGAGDGERLSRLFRALRRYLGRRLGTGVENGGYEIYQADLPTPELERKVEELFSIYEQHRYSGVESLALEEGTERLARGCLEVVDELSGRVGR